MTSKILFTLAILFNFTLYATDTLPSWNDGKNKTNIVDYVNAVTDKRSLDFIAVKDRISAFGNSDGDFAMMLYTEAYKEAKTLQFYVHHTDIKENLPMIETLIWIS